MESDVNHERHQVDAASDVGGVNPTRRRKVVDSEEFASFILRIIRAHARRAQAGDLEALGDLAQLRRDFDVAIDRAVEDLRTEHLASYAEIAQQLGITRQAVQKRYPSDPDLPGRRPGGQPGRLR